MDKRTPEQIDIEYIKLQLDRIENKLDNEFVSHKEFAPVRNLVYGLVSLTMVSVVGALMGIIFVK